MVFFSHAIILGGGTWRKLNPQKCPRPKSRFTGRKRPTYSPTRFVAQANLADGRSEDLRPIQSRQLPGLLQGVRRSSRLVQDLGRHAGHEQSTVLEMVRRRQNQRQL